ncbi:hypothetical protein QQ020_19335 [Fulvivirgaceae bacterium BMA12]|uniref:G-D-S-L family lipolytic protein n=1 Tax=Agaribacillus aureus TaxID=3051825 RepID=A0ABT8L904_9BACT|nr:hypothetical protein [Fulvivirgaceae bacterium BMA12]
MKQTYNLLFGLLAFILVFTACDTEDDLVDQRKTDNPLITPPDPTGTPGSADFSKYIAIGNSITAGYMDGALYDDGQANSFPNLLAAQFRISGIGGGDFNQPAINSLLGFNTIVENPIPGTETYFGRFELDLDIPGPVPVVVTQDELLAFLTPYSGPSINNFGAPGILLGQLLTPAAGGPNDEANPLYNPYYFRFASNPGGSTIIADAIAAQPSFFTLWIGNNDLLGYALSGATNELIFTDDGDFDTQYNAALGSLLTNTTAKGVIVNIPPILALPVFRAVPYNPVPLDEATATTLNTAFGGFNAALDGLTGIGQITADEANKRKVSYAAGTNPLLIFDEDLEDLGDKFDLLVGGGAITSEQRAALEPFVQARPTTAADLVLLSASVAIGEDLNPDAPGTALNGISVPFGDEYILTPEEQAAINERAVAFNTTIGTAAATNSDRIALYDTNSPTGVFFDLFGLSDGVIGAEIEGFNYQPDFSPNGLFSTDAVHPNPKGQAILANEIIGVINAAFGAEIPKVDIVPFRTVLVAQ